MLNLKSCFASSLVLAFVASCSAPESSGGPGGSGNGTTGGNGDGSQGNNNGVDGPGGDNIDLGQMEEEGVIPPDCDNVLDAIVRDFDRSHPDFGGIPYSTGQEGLFIGDEVRRTLVEDVLGANKKPVFRDPVGCAVQDLSTPVGNCLNWSGVPETLTNADNFKEWYLETPGKNFVFDKEIALEDMGDGTYVYDTDAFFPLSIDEGFGETTGDSADNVTAGRNYLFTTEIHLQFTYTPGQKFTFRGDDDLWVFVNGKLAIDLGSMHLPKAATIDFDAQATDLGIAANGSYSMDIFHAERRWNGSNFRIETNISCFVPVTEGIVK